ncbi:hypothetical protein IAG41_05295 [Sphingomonas sp. JC676]|uniref:hypothetical protein n=1 Tax=Sphingomonas sp. JC676 TaxID=2768065 RepID=UPI0016585B28|nr:hypothetical protein [Sphingomonas sp. JC676]MBC9031801.1 hypothetical protein [Sphingomonas sp. JC676]
MTMLRLLLALLLAAPAIAHAQPVPAFASYTDAFDRFAAETATTGPDERVKLFRERFNALVPGFYEPRYGATEEKYNARVAKALADYPATRDKFLATARDFSAAYASGTARFRRFFPDYAPTMPIYLLHSLGEMDGGTRELRGKTVAVFGADVIARIHDTATIGPFLDHELFHFYHASYFPDCEALWCSLWQEGLAVYVASKMNPGADDRALLLTIPRPMRAEVEPHLAGAICLTRAKFDSTSQEDAGEFFMGGAGGKVFPPRFGYYVGYRIAQLLGEKHTLQELAKMPPAQVRKAMLDTMSAIAPCGGSG